MLRIVNQAARDFNAAAHSAGKRLDLRAAPLDQIDGLENVMDVLNALGFGNAVELGVDTEVLFDRKIGVTGERLRNDADHAAHRVWILPPHPDRQPEPCHR